MSFPNITHFKIILFWKGLLSSTMTLFKSPYYTHHKLKQSSGYIYLILVKKYLCQYLTKINILTSWNSIKPPFSPISLSKLLLSRIFRETNTLCSMPAEFYLQFAFTLTSSSPSSLIFFSFSPGWQVQTVSISYLRCLIEHVRCYLLDRDIELIYYTIRKSSDVLTRDPMQLGAQVSSEKKKTMEKKVPSSNSVLSLCSCNCNIYLLFFCISLFLPILSPLFCHS